MITLKGGLSISRVSSTREEDYVSIRVTDEDARCEAIDVKVSMVEFALALMGSGERKCEFEFNDSGNIGTIHEHKEEMVPTEAYSIRGEDEQKVALSPFEVDGWRARSGDISNHHRHFSKDGKHYQRVVFFRNVPRGGAE